MMPHLERNPELRQSNETLFSQFLAQEQADVHAKTAQLPSVSSKTGPRAPSYAKTTAQYNPESLGALLQASRLMHKNDSKQVAAAGGESDSSCSPPAAKLEVPSEVVPASFSPVKRVSSRGGEQVLSQDESGARLEAGKELTPRPPTTSKYSSGVERQKGLVLESLSQQEARGLLRQASLERLGSSNISSFVTSASKAKGFTFKDQGRVATPEGRLLVSICSFLVSTAVAVVCENVYWRYTFL